MRGIVLILGFMLLHTIIDRDDRSQIGNAGRIAALILWALILTWAMWLTPAAAHDWYPRECCAAQLDCHPIPCESLTSLPKGFVEYTPLSKLFESSKVRPSQDSQCHVCLHGSEQSPICVFTQQGV